MSRPRCANSQGNVSNHCGSLQKSSRRIAAAMTGRDMFVSDSDTDPQEQSEDSNSSNANRLIDLYKQRLKLRAAATVEFRHGSSSTGCGSRHRRLGSRMGAAASSGPESTSPRHASCCSSAADQCPPHRASLDAAWPSCCTAAAHHWMRSTGC